MIRVDHVDIAEVGGRRFVGDVDGMAQRQVPDGEGLELGIARAHPPLVLMVELREAGGELPAARPGSRDHDERLGRFYVRVRAVSFVRNDDVHFRRVPFRFAVNIRFQPVVFEFGDEFVRRGLPEVLRDDDAVHVQPEAAHLVDEAKDVRPVRDTEVRAYLVALEVCAADDENDLRLFFQLQEDAALRVALEAGQNAAGVHVVEQLASELEVELVVELADALQYLFALKPDI